jgi:hypothetical protein
MHVRKVTNWEQRQNHNKTRNVSLLIENEKEKFYLEKVTIAKIV